MIEIVAVVILFCVAAATVDDLNKWRQRPRGSTARPRGARVAFLVTNATPIWRELRAANDDS